MREGEPQRVVRAFASLGIAVELIDARADFLAALKGIDDPEEKRNAITSTFYKTVFGRLVQKSGAKFLLHGTILTDIEETSRHQAAAQYFGSTWNRSETGLWLPGPGTAKEPS